MTYTQWKRMKWLKRIGYAPLMSTTEAWRVLVLERTMRDYGKTKSMAVAKARIACAWDCRVRDTEPKSGWGQLILARA